MDSHLLDKGVKERLILSGLNELLHHGSSDFSLRRVAIGAEVSCAAPYRHFKDKDDLIHSIILYILDDYKLLADSIADIFGKGTREYVLELATATVRFWIAGDNFPSFLATGELSAFDEPLSRAICDYLCDDAMREEKRRTVLALIYGYLTGIVSGALLQNEAIDSMQRAIIEVLGEGSDA